MERNWLEEKMEGRVQASADELPSTAEKRQREALWRLVRTDQLEAFFRKKFPSTKKFGIEGGEALIPGLWALLENSARLGVENMQFGMAHRGRLNMVSTKRNGNSNCIILCI